MTTPLPTFTSARTHHRTPHGRIDVAWSLDDGTGRLDVTVPDGTGRLDVTVPDGTDAELVLPDGTTDRLAPGTHHRSWG